MALKNLIRYNGLLYQNLLVPHDIEPLGNLLNAATEQVIDRIGIPLGSDFGNTHQGVAVGLVLEDDNLVRVVHYGERVFAQGLEPFGILHLAAVQQVA